MSIDLNEKELSAIKAIRNSIVHFGTAPSTRQLMQMLGYKSTYSITLILEKLADAGYIKKENGKIRFIKDLESSNAHARTINIPLVGNAPCGAPFLAEQNIEAEIPVSTKLATPSHKYFLLRAVGDSMNLKNINNGDLVLVRQQNTAENGDVVVALIDDEATIKEFERKKNIVLLKPKSKNKNHKPIILTDDFVIQGKIIATINNF
jgi:repressor LexA